MLAVHLEVEVDDDVDHRGEGQRDEDPEVVEVEPEVLESRVDPTLPVTTSLAINV